VGWVYTKELGQRLEIARAIIKELSEGSVRRSQLEKHIFRSHDITLSRFRCMMAFLVVDGDIEKLEGDRFAPYRITAKGRAFLAWRSLP
jgi:predicted transcriptional regulator